MSEARLYTLEEIEQILDQVVVEVRRELSSGRRAKRVTPAAPRISWSGEPA